MNRDGPDSPVAAAATPSSAVCNHCNSDDRWILHNVRHRGIYRRLCTSCVLKLNSSSFCPICFALYDRPKKPPSSTAAPAPPIIRSTLTCFKCGSLSHANCVPPNAPKSPYLCPTCANPNSKLFDFRKPLNTNTNNNPKDRKDVGVGEAKKPNLQQQNIDLKSSKVFLAAAMIAANSMNDAAEMAKAEAEKRAKEWVMARKSAKDALENIASLWGRERLRQRQGTAEAEILVSAIAVPNPRGGNLTLEGSGSGGMGSFGLKTAVQNPVDKNGGNGVVVAGAKRKGGDRLIPAWAQLSAPNGGGGAAAAAAVVRNKGEEGSNGGQVEKKDAVVDKHVGSNGLQSGSQNVQKNNDSHRDGDGNLGHR